MIWHHISLGDARWHLKEVVTSCPARVNHSSSFAVMGLECCMTGLEEVFVLVSGHLCTHVYGLCTDHIKRLKTKHRSKGRGRGRAVSAWPSAGAPNIRDGFDFGGQAQVRQLHTVPH